MSANDISDYVPMTEADLIEVAMTHVDEPYVRYQVIDKRNDWRKRGRAIYVDGRSQEEAFLAFYQHLVSSGNANSCYLRMLLGKGMSVNDYFIRGASNTSAIVFTEVQAADRDLILTTQGVSRPGAGAEEKDEEEEEEE